MAEKKQQVTEGSIFNRVSAIATREDVLITGEKARGKSSLARDVAVKAGYKDVLYVAFGSPFTDLPANWFGREVSSLLDLRKLQADIGKHRFNAIILDDYSASMALHTPDNATPSRQEFGIAAVRWSKPVYEIASACDNLIMTVNAVHKTSDDGKDLGLGMDLTPRGRKNIEPRFNRVYFVWKATGGQYLVQTEADKSLDFEPKGSMKVEDFLGESQK